MKAKRKFWKIVLGILFILIFVAPAVILALLSQAFGPRYKTVEKQINSRWVLVCDETYGADLAAEFYDVRFWLQSKDKEKIELGSIVFSDKDWSQEITIDTLRDWFILSATEFSYVKILTLNTNSFLQADTVFSPQNLGENQEWRKRYGERPAWPYYGRSSIDSIEDNRIYVSYHYRIGINEPFVFYDQTVIYYLDSRTGRQLTYEILERRSAE